MGSQRVRGKGWGHSKCDWVDGVTVSVMEWMGSQLGWMGECDGVDGSQ